MSLIKMVNSNQKALIDAKDYAKVNQFHWRYNKGYAETKINGKTIGMHRFIISAPKGSIVDHINHNKLDNRKDNLRVVNYQLNSLNRLTHKNNKVGKRNIVKLNNKFVVYFGLDNEKHYLGSYSTLKIAEVVANFFDNLIHHLAHQNHQNH